MKITRDRKKIIFIFGLTFVNELIFNVDGQI